MVSSADMVTEITKKHDVIFFNRPKTTAGDILLYGCKDVAFSPYGEASIGDNFERFVFLNF